jgi:hypothetical protein
MVVHARCDLVVVTPDVRIRENWDWSAGFWTFTLFVNIAAFLSPCSHASLRGVLLMFSRLVVCLVVLLVFGGSLGLSLAGYWEAKFYSGPDMEEYWRYSDNFGTLLAHSMYYPIADMEEGQERDFYTKIERSGSLSKDWWVVNHFVWDDELEWVSGIKSGSGVQFLFDSGGNGYHHYDTRWKFTGAGTYKWFKSGARLEAVSTGETCVRTISHASDEDPWPDNWEISFASSGHRYFWVE